MGKLVLTIDEVAINEYPLDKSRIHIGRSGDNDILVDDPIVSGRHALLNVKKSAYMPGLDDVVIQDLKSTNGTRVNGRAIKSLKLKHGDVIEIGRSCFRYDDGKTDVVDTTAIYVPDDDSGRR